MTPALYLSLLYAWFYEWPCELAAFASSASSVGQVWASECHPPEYKGGILCNSPRRREERKPIWFCVSGKDGPLAQIVLSL